MGHPRGTSLEKVKRHPTPAKLRGSGAGAKILGDITIGSHSRIGANAVVVKDAIAIGGGCARTGDSAENAWWTSTKWTCCTATCQMPL